jgi:ABC-type uncharacterized transport system ATPase subunit
MTVQSGDEAVLENAAVHGAHLASRPERLPQPAVRVRGVTKAFGPVHTLQGVDLALLSGEAHGLVGANAAGRRGINSAILRSTLARGRKRSRNARRCSGVRCAARACCSTAS